MADRYFVESPITDDRATVTGAEAHHLIHVMRAKPGSRVTLFDGSGDEFAAEVRRVGRSEVELGILSRETVDRELAVSITLGVALPKGDRQRWLVEKAVEIGVARIVPLATARGVAQPVKQALDRLRRAVIEASKQCGRNRLMEIADPRSWSDFVADTADVPCRLLAHPGEERGGEGARGRGGEGATGMASADGCNRVALAIGPEGGFTEEEVALAVLAGWQPVDLGPRILRVETAAILLAATVIQAIEA